MGKDINTIVDVQIDKLTKFPSRVGFGVPLVMDINTVQAIGAVDTFTDTAAMVTAGFTTGDEAVKAATALFSQNPKVPEIRVARREANVAKVVTVTIDTVANLTNYDVTLAGVLFQFTSSGAATDIEIRDGLIALIDANPAYNAVLGASNTFTITGAVAGDDFSVVVSAELSFVVTTPSVNASSEILRIDQVLSDWYFLVSTSRVEKDILDSAITIETKVKLYGFETDQAAIKDTTVGADTTSIGAVLFAALRERTFWVWTKTSNLPTYPSAAWIGKIAPKDPGSVTWKFKSVSGPVADNELTDTEIKNIEDKKGNVYLTVADLNIFGEGRVASGEFIDIVRGTDKLTARLQENVFGLLATEDKIPFSDKGGDALEVKVREPLQQAVTDDLLLGGADAPVITIPKVADIPQAQRALRQFGDIEFQGKYAGAVHKVDIRGRISV